MVECLTFVFNYTNGSLNKKCLNHLSRLSEDLTWGLVQTFAPTLGNPFVVKFTSLELASSRP